METGFFLFDILSMERIELFDGMIFGRDAACDIQIEDEAVSGTHFQIKIIDNVVYVLDLDSSNKTYLNDAPLLRGLSSPRRIKEAAFKTLEVGCPNPALR